MKGELLILYPMRPPERRQYFGPPPSSIITELVEGPAQLVPLFDQVVNFDGIPSKAVAFCNEEASRLNMPDNFWASALWHFIVRSKGESRRPLILKGPVVILTGDEEFLNDL